MRVIFALLLCLLMIFGASNSQETVSERQQIGRPVYGMQVSDYEIG